ncbi:enoyl-CoA hydratase/isomerase family protein [Albidovulum sp.]|uniref:enoyl-CoA hydratase/isomerase family protein n=1 Tax=Albidovulum sp. TaxID=1872424 RepID=UPI001E08BFAD|nr:enoyl-CoA hydratase/isomerase family protein [Paracoccaceae bacterium]MCC0046272.1 enoyl-CoA hydratase/isomerase family protein [Defluviimonas sp.]MCP5355496.1 enoyl-CoA hydratase/isomerase family protein [Paracoccaceae bacterium]HPE26933.1 enoyl-CoA hydratase/isomerase family protein [Albidovulum sp.]HRV62767.1 enoyl-CoA hydratase/isomerase family protein [Albidovulum sp.]
MDDIWIRKEGRAGRITLSRPKALNALTYAMCRQIDAALIGWAGDPDVALVLIDAEGDRAFCAGGDIAEMYATGTAGDFDYGRRFWADEYRMNARLAEYPKPVASFLQGFTMGGGVGVGCHGSHRIVGESAQVAMPECGIGLVPDVGGSFILATAPGRLGEYLGTTGARMGAADAILAGFADHFVPEAAWDDLKARLIETGDAGAVAARDAPPPEGVLAALRPRIDRLFAGDTLADIARALAEDGSDFATGALKALGRAAPLSAACTIEMIRRLRGGATIRRALDMEYRFTFRAMEHADFIEGIRAAIIDKDRNPHWRHAGPDAVRTEDIDRMLNPLGADALSFEED